MIINSATDPRAAERTFAAVAASVLVFTMIGGMALWLQTLDPSAPQRASIETIELTPEQPRPLPRGELKPAPANPVEEPAGGSRDTAEQDPQASLVAPSLFQWSVTRMTARAVPSPSSGRLSAAGPPGLGPSAGMGGSGVFDPYAGSSPQWQGQVNQAPQSPLDEAAMLQLRNAVASLIGSGGPISCDVLVGLNGTILEARCSRSSGEVIEALPARIVGMRLFDIGNTAWRTTLQL